MPTCFIINGIRFYFYSNDHEPIHIHVTKGKGKGEVHAKFNVVHEVELVENDGFSMKDISKIHEIIQEKKEDIIRKWREHFVIE